MGRTVILSDLHLGSEACRTDELLTFLRRRDWDWLYVNGDILDHLDLRQLKKKHWQILHLLQDARAYAVVGNHDVDKEGSELLLRSLFEHCSLDAVITVGGGHGGNRTKLYRLTHGHLFDPLLNFTLLTDLADQAYHVSQKLNKRLSRWLKKKSKSFGGVIDNIIQRAVQTSKADGFHGVILGHTHHFEDRFVDGFHYLNSGCWTGNELPTYVEAVDAQLPCIKTFQP